MDVQHKEMLLASLKENNSAEVVVSGWSMWPFIKAGDTVSIRNKPFFPAIGSVVAFFEGDQLIVHRMIRKRQTGKGGLDMVVHGDSAPFSRSKISPDQVVGFVEYVKRGNKKMSLWFAFPFNIFAICIGLVLQFLKAVKAALCSRNVK